MFKKDGRMIFMAAGKTVMLEMKLILTASVTRAPKRVSGGTSLIISTLKPNPIAAKLKSSARPVDIRPEILGDRALTGHVQFLTVVHGRALDQL